MQPPEPVNLEVERSVASIIAQALDLYQGYPLLFLTLASAVIVPYELAVLAVTGSGSLASTHMRAPGRRCSSSYSTSRWSVRSSRPCTCTPWS